MEAKLKIVAEMYLDFLIQRLENPDANVQEINDCIRVLYPLVKISRPQNEKTFAENISDYRHKLERRPF